MSLFSVCIIIVKVRIYSGISVWPSFLFSSPQATNFYAFRMSVEEKPIWVNSFYVSEDKNARYKSNKVQFCLLKRDKVVLAMPPIPCYRTRSTRKHAPFTHQQMLFTIVLTTTAHVEAQ